MPLQATEDGFSPRSDRKKKHPPVGVEVARGRHCRDRRPDGPQIAIKERLIDLAADYGCSMAFPK